MFSVLLLWGAISFGQPFPLTNTRYMATVSPAAKRQIAPMAVSSVDTTLVAWLEIDTDGVWHLGFRGADGSWREQALSVNDVRRIATDGRDFVVITKDEAMRFDRNGALLQPATPLPFSPAAVAWDGSHYVIAGTTPAPPFRNNIVAARLTASGVLSPVSVLRAPESSQTSLASPRVASDGRGTALVIWMEQFFPMQPLPSRPSIAGAMLPATYPIAAPKSFLIEPTLGSAFPYISMDVAWDGTRYVVANANLYEPKGVFAHRVSAAGVPEPNRITLSTAESLELSMTAAGDGVGIGWSSYDAPVRDHVSLVDRGGEVSTPGVFPRPPLWVAPTYVAAALPDGRLAYVGFDNVQGAPYYGSHRILMAIADPDLAPGVADAPTLSVERNGAELRVRWTTPPQPVNGYRLEYRTGSGPWTELEHWFTARETTASFTPVPPAAAWSFRVRAWSDGGTSAYSNEAIVAPKRRSVR